MQIGAIFRVSDFYSDPTTGELKPKFLAILALPNGGDIVARLLTSRHPELRREEPPCFHGAPYPGFYLGVLGSPLELKSWMDLRFLDDIDGDQFAIKIKKGSAIHVADLPKQTLISAMECVASAPDTTFRQEKSIRDSLSNVR